MRHELPHLTTEQMREVDRAMIQDFHIELLQMMENAGRSLAHLARVRFLGGNPLGKRVAVLAGPGGNGGGALAGARRLHNWGAQVEVSLSHPVEALKATTAHQLDILMRMQVPVAQADAMDKVSSPLLIVDGLIGYGLSGNPRGATADLIRWANAQNCAVLALDVPSGMDTTTGKVFDPAIRATATLALALPKRGFQPPEAAPYIGELYVADIGVPPSLYARAPLSLSLSHVFAEDDIIRLR